MGRWTSTLEALAIETVLVTGGLGCIGAGLSQLLSNAGFNVIIGSSRVDAKLPDSLKKCELAYIDLEDIDLLVNLCYEVDYIVHLAAINAEQSQTNPELAVKVNGVGTYNLVQASVKAQVNYFLYFSTAHVYGAPLQGEIDEKLLPRPLHPYAITHRLAEDFLIESIRKYNLPGSILRLSNVVGLPLVKEANCWMLFVNDICRQAVLNREIVIKNNPYIERDSVSSEYIYKVVCDFLDHKPHSDLPIYNLGSGSSKSLLDIAQLVINRCETLFGFVPRLIHSKDKKKSVLSLFYKVEKLENFLGLRTSDDNLIASIDEILIFFKDR